MTTSEALSAVEDEPPLATPHGLDEIIALFGNISEYIGEDGKLEARWQLEFPAKVIQPYPRRLSWDPSRTIPQMTCHRRMTRFYICLRPHSRMWTEHKDHELWRMLCLPSAVNRQETVDPRLGHCDRSEPGDQPAGAVGDMDAVVIEIFRRAGFEWGVDWRGKTRDPMHFQFCTGY